MGLPGTVDSSVYDGLRDVLRRYPVVTAVTYEPDSIVKRFLRATVDPNRVTPATGPSSPTLDVEWRYADDLQYYRIHYATRTPGFEPAAGIATTTIRNSVRYTSRFPIRKPARPITSAPPSASSSRRRYSGPALDRLFETRIPKHTSEA